MKTLALLALLVARLALANPSTTYLWSETNALDGQGTSNVLLGTTNPTCTSWVPVEGITNATSITAWITLAAASGKKCSFSIYDAGGSTRIMTTGETLCDSTGVFQATGLTPFTLLPGVKYQRCWCGEDQPSFLSYNTSFGSDFGRGIRNTLSVPLRFTGSTACGTHGAAPSTLGSFSAGDARPAFVLFGTNTP